MAAVGKYFDLDPDSTLGGATPSDYVIPSQKAISDHFSDYYKAWFGTQAEFDLIQTYDQNTIYYIETV